MPAAQALNIAVVSHVTRAENLSLVNLSHNTTATKTKVVLSTTGVTLLPQRQLSMGEPPFICFCWSFATAALEGKFIVLETEAL